MMNNVIPIYASEQYRAAEKEKTLNTLKYRTALSVLRRLHNNKEISEIEFARGQEFLARRFNQQTV